MKFDISKVAVITLWMRGKTFQGSKVCQSVSRRCFLATDFNNKLFESYLVVNKFFKCLMKIKH